MPIINAHNKGPIKKHKVLTKIMLLSLLSLIQYRTVCHYHSPTHSYIDHAHTYSLDLYRQQW